jgi:hypothetical protein
MLPALATGLLACGSSQTKLEIRDNNVFLDGRRALDASEIDRSPLDAHLPELLDALEAEPPGPATVALSPDDPWYRARTLYHALGESGRTEVWFEGQGGARFGPIRATTDSYRTQCMEPLLASGAAPIVRLDLHHGSDGDWIEASARLQPVIRGRPADLAAECWSGRTCALTFPPGKLLSACEEGSASGAPDRVTLGGKSGCAAPIARAGDSADWARELGEALHDWGLDARSELVLSPEPAVPYRRFTEVLGAIAAAGAQFPLIPEAMVQGNEGPPLCTADVRDAVALETAAARWYGANLRDAPPVAPIP